jgi:hypothetical protein
MLCRPTVRCNVLCRLIIRDSLMKLESDPDITNERKGKTLKPSGQGCTNPKR